MDVQQGNALTYSEILAVLRGLRFPEHPRERQIMEAVRFGTANSAEEIRGNDYGDE